MRRETTVLRAATRAEPDVRENAMIGKTLRSFRIISQIGEGGMGVVYLAEHVGLSKRFAIKSLSKALSGDPDFRQRFYEEARKQAMLDDPNIVQVTDFFEDTGEFFLVIEYVDGQDLSDLIRSKGRLTEAEAIPIVREILKGLGFAHAKGLVHRDMKPSNVLVDRSGRTRIMDFGIAIMAGGAEKSLTATGAIIGSPRYMSPEQIVRPPDVDHRTDIYSLGIVLYEMLTGSVPFAGESDFSVQDQQVRAPARDPRERNPTVSEAVARIILKAMAKDPANRFQTCAEFIEAINAVATHQRRSRLIPIVAALAATLVAGVGLILHLEARPEARVTPDRAGDGPAIRADVPPEDTGAAKANDLAPGRSPLDSPVNTGPLERPSLPEGRTLRSPIERSGQEKDLERRSLYNVIQSGSEKAWFTCTQFEQLKRKEVGLQSARLIQDTNIEERIRSQITDHRANIDSALSEYAQFLEQLASADTSIVGEQFDKYSRSLEARKSFRQIQVARLMKRHYERHRTGAGRLALGAMGTDCETALGKGT